MIGGLFASWVMGHSQKYIKQAKEKAEQAAPAVERVLEWRAAESAPSEEESATVKAATLVSTRVFGREIPEERRKAAGEAVHYAFGAFSGGIYGALAEYLPEAKAGMGSIFGTALWALSDELAVPLAGWAGPPQQYQVGVHASALAAHLVYGVSTELVRGLLRSGVLAR